MKSAWQSLAFVALAIFAGAGCAPVEEGVSDEYDDALGSAQQGCAATDIACSSPDGGSVTDGRDRPDSTYRPDEVGCVASSGNWSYGLLKSGCFLGGWCTTRTIWISNNRGSWYREARYDTGSTQQHAVYRVQLGGERELKVEQWCTNNVCKTKYQHRLPSGAMVTTSVDGCNLPPYTP
jgi:hypothetical protein